ncbi:MAG TPA: DUF2203 domain-containing protein [Candidatus Dormibacteraeota bacterium]|jgi:hypothetical protein|nr:DUF2203 domain-containing protein [Candidatus Dormibacteraeota bacterium]
MASRPGEPDRQGPDRGPVYTVAQANRLLPSLIPVLRSLVVQLGAATDAEALGRVRSAEGHNGGGAAASAMLQAGDRVEREMEFLKQHGILLRDARSGLVDFPAEREGRPAYLCWQLGESAVEYWHQRDEGYVNRQPL